MTDDDDEAIPAFLRLTPEERAVAWQRNPPRTVSPVYSSDGVRHYRTPADEEAAQAYAREQEEHRKHKTAARIRKLKESKQPQPDRSGQRWDARRNRWMDDK